MISYSSAPAFAGAELIVSELKIFVALLFLRENECASKAHTGCAEQAEPDRQIRCVAGLRGIQLLLLRDVGGIAGHGVGDCRLPACKDVALAGRLLAFKLRRLIMRQD